MLDARPVVEALLTRYDETSVCVVTDWLESVGLDWLESRLKSASTQSKTALRGELERLADIFDIPIPNPRLSEGHWENDPAKIAVEEERAGKIADGVFYFNQQIHNFPNATHYTINITEMEKSLARHEHASYP